MSVVKELGGGNSGALVLHTQKNGKEFVVKIPMNESSEKEIEENLGGYERIQRAGLYEILPDCIKVGEFNDRKYIVMSYLEEDFAQQSMVSERPLSLYSIFPVLLGSIYRRTKKKDEESRKFLERMKHRLEKNYREYLIPSGVMSKISLKLLYDIETHAPELSCFAVFDFTPEDVYLIENKIKYPDPKQEIRGVPIIDIACFAGLAKDVYHLPSSNEGYDILKKFALNEVPEILEMSRNDARIIFYYGRALQLSLSSRFRIKSETEKAKMYATKSLEYLHYIRSEVGN
jgi:hypothetical protein